MGGRFEFSKFLKKGGSNFSHKKGGFGKTGGVLKNRGGTTYLHTH